MRMFTAMHSSELYAEYAMARSETWGDGENGNSPEKCAGFLENEIFQDIARLFLTESVAVEVLGGRRTGKSRFIRALVDANSASEKTLLVVTKGLISGIKSPCKTAVSLQELVQVLEHHLDAAHRVRLLCIDTLSTLLAGNTQKDLEEHAYDLIRALACTGTRVIVVSSVINVVRRSSEVYEKTYIFRHAH
ncbi:uncharacterized protein NEMAJ01_2317 [Nematocida major]|uniref:uncharacterized protein n=1 Tax=Nematocida major TaxID=1912982 RepID=UPI0020075AB1|nr:uncharacterized protein NEMAJ01_2317 [Nematocida major]KAH9387421.1 hypothetical protein NEMAJ01_2317 [Nematocida major]